MMANAPGPLNINELIRSILHGNIKKGFPEPPSRVVKFFISSTKTDFESERQHLHDVVIPDLERYCNALSLDLLVIDPHWQAQPIVLSTEVNLVCNGDPAVPTSLGPNGAMPRSPIITDPSSSSINPYEFELQLKEIEEAAHQSAASFYMCLIGHKYRPLALPTAIPSDDFKQIFNAAAESGLGDVSLLCSCYKENRNLQPAPQYVLLEPRRASRQYEEDLEHIAKLVEYGSKVAAREGLLSDRFGTVMSAVHQQTLHALEVARLINAGQASSPTSKTQVAAVNQIQISSTSGHLGVKSPRHHFLASNTVVNAPKLSTLLSGETAVVMGTVTSSASPVAVRRAKAGRLMHQTSLQQGPTQKRIAMPRQTSVTTNYALMQQPIDRMLCFIRQFEGVNFNNAHIVKYFDVTPTSNIDEQSPQPFNGGPAGLLQSLGSVGSHTLSSSQPPQQQRPLFAPAAQSDIQQLIEDVILGLKKGNVHYFNISWSPPETEAANIATRTYTLPEHYIERFGVTVLRTLKESIDAQLALPQNALVGLFLPGSNLEYPVEIIREAHSHLSNLRRVSGAIGMAQAIESDFAHLLQIRELMVAKANQDEPQAQSPQVGGAKRSSRHQPIVVTGRQGAGKSTLLAQVFTYAPEWLVEATDREVIIRIIRQCGQSLSSNFASELLRSLCLQVAIAYGFESQLARCGEAHELSELALCFQELLKMIETTPGADDSDLLVILDDLHLLQSIFQSSALLGWMPWHLPANVHIICSVASEAEVVLGIMRSRISADNFVHLDDLATEPLLPSRESARRHQIYSLVQCKLRDEKRTLTPTQWEVVRQKLIPTPAVPLTSDKANAEPTDIVQPEEMTPLYANMLASAVLSTWESFFVPEYMPLSVDEIVATILVDLEECLPYTLVRLICSYLVCTKYGFREAELYSLVQDTLVTQVWPELALPRAPTEAGGTPDPGEYPRTSASAWLLLKTKLRPLLKEYYVQGHLYLNWRSPKVSRSVMDRYLSDARLVRTIHQELASAFSSSYADQHQQQVAQQKATGARLREVELVREADEMWYHFLCAGNREHLKSHALLNVKFLMTMIEGVSVCYLRCILDAVRSQILDWDVELLYGMLKQSVHVVAQDSSQLPVESVLWLAPFVCPASSAAPVSLSQFLDSRLKLETTAASNPSSHLEEFLRQAYRVCLDAKRPLLYPANVWLNLPIPPQVAMITCPWAGIVRAASTPDAQHLIACEGKMLHFFHVPTKTVAKSVEDSSLGSKSTITCLHLSGSGRYLATGSSDTTVSLWQVESNRMTINECKLRYKFNHHIAGVLCVTINTAETLVLSGSEVGTICVVNLRNSQLMTRLEHHRGLVTCLAINAGDDVLVSSSTDRTVVIWSLETFCILNEILLMRPVLHMDISLDSTFFLLSLDDNSLLVRALTTGTAIHTLQTSATVGGSAVISYVRFAEDNCRAVVGYADGRVLVFDIHSARQIATLSGHTEMITAIIPQKDDHFLITCGGNKIIIWNFFPAKRIDVAPGEALDKSLHEALEVSQTSSASGSISEKGGAEGGGGGSFSESGCGGDTIIGSSSKNFSSGHSSRTSSDRRKHKPSGSFRKKTSVPHIEHHREPITCAAVSRDGQYVISGGRDCLVKIWQTFTGETHTTLEEHSAPITCVDIAPNSQVVVSGAEDGVIKVWSITLELVLCTFVEHKGASIVTVKCMSDSKRVLSADTGSTHRLWQLDTGTQLRVIVNKPVTSLKLHGLTVMAIGGKMENCVKYWSCYEPEAEKTVSHSDIVTCFTSTHSGKRLITGSLDMSLKVWESATAKLTQVLVGHEGGITCVATAALNETLVVSGAQDCNLIVWDMETGTEVFTLARHNAAILGVILTPDANRAISYSEDNTIQLWDIGESGRRLSLLEVHRNFVRVYASANASYLAVLLGGSLVLPIIRHHYNPSHGVLVELPAAGGAPAPTSATDERGPAWLRGLAGSGKRHGKTLKREQTYDSSYFEHILHRGQSVDDFRKIGALNAALEKAGLVSTPTAAASPYGSRETLWTGGGSGIYDGTTTAGVTAPTSTTSTTRSRMISKLMNIGPKQKLLKKQQSMFACFPEFTGKPTAIGSSGAASTGNELLSSFAHANGTKKSIVLPSPTPSRRSAMARAQSVGDDEDSSGSTGSRLLKNGADSASKVAETKPKIETVVDSSVCTIM